MQERLLREYIRETLMCEGLESLSGLEAIFVTPFTDVLKTGKAVVSDISSKSQYLIGGAMASIISAFVPGMEVDWKELKQKERERSEKIAAKYEDVFDRTNQALFTGDAALMSFLYAPHAFITTRALNKAPNVALDMLDTLGGENVSGITEPLRQQWEKIRLPDRKGGPQDTGGYGGYGGGGYGYGDDFGYGDYGGYGDDGGDGDGGESVERDDDDILQDSEIVVTEGILDKLKQKLQGMLNNKKVAQAVNNSPKAKAMRKDAVAMAKEHVKTVVGKAKEATNTRSTKTLEKYSDGKFLDVMKKVPDEDRQKAAAVVAKQTAKLAKKFYIEQLKAEAKQLPKGLQQIYQQGIEAIEGL